MRRTALIVGVSGQDGAYLAKNLLSKGYKVVGSSRDAQLSSFQNLKKIGVFSEVEFISMYPSDFRSVFQAVSATLPDEIYNLSGQSSVGLSFEQPVETMESIVGATLNLLEVIRIINSKIKLYNASSGEIFGESEKLADENSAFRPQSPYGVAKATAAMQTAVYRKAYGLYAVSGFLFNHESPLRPSRFVTKKIITSACRIASGSNEKLILGNLNVNRDWGWAPEYVEAMWRMLQLKSPEDFVISTGRISSLEKFVEMAFDYFKLDWREYVSFSVDCGRPLDIETSGGSPIKAADKLGWSAESTIEKIVERMIENEMIEKGKYNA